MTCSQWIVAQVLIVDTWTDFDYIHHIEASNGGQKEDKNYYSTDNVTTRVYLNT